VRFDYESWTYRIFIRACIEANIRPFSEADQLAYDYVMFCDEHFA
jgi:hypothetical protein